MRVRRRLFLQQYPESHSEVFHKKLEDKLGLLVEMFQMCVIATFEIQS